MLIERDVADILIAEFGDDIPRWGLLLRPGVIRKAAEISRRDGVSFERAAVTAAVEVKEMGGRVNDVLEP